MPPLYPRPSSEHESDASTPAVVVIDDEPQIVDVVCDCLADAEILTEGCMFGRHALACIRQKQPRVVILDVQMPELDGVELFKQLRGDPATRTIPVIFLTANSHKLTDRLPDYESMNAALIRKPFSIGLLIDRVSQALGM